MSAEARQQQHPYSGSSAPIEGVPVRISLYFSLAGIILTVASTVIYSISTWKAARVGHQALDLSGSFAQYALQAEVSCQRYLMSGDRKSLSEHEEALEKTRSSAKKLGSVADALYYGSVTLAPAIHEAVSRLDAWDSGYAGPAIALKRAGDTRRLSTLNRKGASTALSLALRDAVSDLRSHVDSALEQNSGRAILLSRVALTIMIAGILLLAFAGTSLLQRVRTILASLRSHGEALELLAHWSERIQHSYSDDQAATTLATTITKKLGMNRATVLLREPATQELRVAADIRTKEGVPPAERRDARMCPVIVTGQPIFCEHSDGINPCANCVLNQDIKGGYLCVPLTAQGGVVGVIRTEGPDGKPLKSATVQRIESLVRLTSITLNTLLSLGEAKQQATTDGLTEVFNRRFLDVFLNKQVQVANRSKQNLSVLMMDLDHFKKFNDRYGHAAGDSLLRAFAMTVTQTVREGDLLARYGGEEFTVVLPNTGLEEALAMGERVRAAAESVRLDILPNLPVPVMTVSIGAASVPASGTTMASLMQSADSALYKAKESGRNQVKSA